MKKKLYIAYGSNINLEQMAHRCPHSRVVGTAMIPDYELQFRNVATIFPKPGAEVPVLLWEIPPRDERNLDVYEGFPRLYRTENLEFEFNGQTVTGMAYVMNYGSISPPSTGYYECIRKGYLTNGMDTKYLDQALVNSYQPDADVSFQQEETEDQEDGLSEEDGWSFWGTM